MNSSKVSHVFESSCADASSVVVVPKIVVGLAPSDRLTWLHNWVKVTTCATATFHLVCDFSMLIEGGSCNFLVVVGVDFIVAKGSCFFLGRFLSFFCFGHVSFEKFKVRILGVEQSLELLNPFVSCCLLWFVFGLHRSILVSISTYEESLSPGIHVILLVEVQYFRLMPLESHIYLKI